MSNGRAGSNQPEAFAHLKSLGTSTSITLEVPHFQMGTYSSGRVARVSDVLSATRTLTARTEALRKSGTLAMGPASCLTLEITTSGRPCASSSSRADAQDGRLRSRAAYPRVEDIRPCAAPHTSFSFSDDRMHACRFGVLNTHATHTNCRPKLDCPPTMQRLSKSRTSVSREPWPWTSWRRSTRVTGWPSELCL